MLNFSLKPSAILVSLQENVLIFLLSTVISVFLLCVGEGAIDSKAQGGWV